MPAKQPIVGIYFSGPNFDDPPFHNSDYRRAYHDLAGMLAARGATCVIVRGQQTFLGGGRFSRAWHFRDGAFHLSEEPVTVDVVYNKGEAFQADDATTMVNAPALDALCRHKQRTIEAFPEYFPRSRLVHTPGELQAGLTELQGDTIVSKPTDSWGGHGVYVGPRDGVAANIGSYPALVQEFIDTSAGIPGIVDGTHDLRILIIGGRVALCYVRVPPSGSAIANVAQGGNITLVAEKDIPEEALAIAKKVDEKMAVYGRRVYSVDMGFHLQREWRLFELNPQPGLTSLKWGEGVRQYYEMLVGELLQ